MHPMCVCVRVCADGSRIYVRTDDRLAFSLLCLHEACEREENERNPPTNV